MTFKPIFILLIIFFLGCKKESNLSNSTELVSLVSYEAGSVNEGISITYKLSSDKILESGVYFGTDSAALISPDAKTAYIKKTPQDGQTQYSLVIATPQGSSNLWFRVSCIDNHHKQILGPVVKVTLNPVALNWADNFNKKMHIEDWLYRDIMLIGKITDTQLNNYEITLGPSTCMLWKIAPEGGLANTYRFYIQVPAATPVGVFDFQVRYKSKLIFNDKIEIEKGDLYETFLASEFPEQNQAFSYFTFNNNFYAITLSNTKRIFKWDMITNNWNQTSSVPEKISLSEGIVGKQHLNKIWFPFSVNDRIINQATYDPQNDKWEIFSVSNTFEDYYIKCFDSFLFQGDLYYLMGLTPRRSEGTYKALLMKLDIQNRTLVTVTTLPEAGVGYKGIVIDNSVFITATIEKSNTNATSHFYSKLFEYNPQSNTFTQKAPMIFKTVEKGSLNPNLFEYNKHLFFYGGETSSGYFPNISYDLYDFDPKNNTWKQIFAKIDFTHASALNNFCFVQGSKVYFGFGLRPLYYRTNTVVMLDFNWHY